MSFLLDAILIGILLGTVAVYCRRSLFSALTGAAALAVAAVGAVLLAEAAAAPVAANLTAPLAERAVANELADMFSAPHYSNGRDTVASLPLGDLVEQEPEAYLRLLEEYNVSPEAVRAAYLDDSYPVTVLTAVTRGFSDALAKSVVLPVLTALFALILRLIAHRVEENLPPRRAYRGIKRLLPGAVGILAGVILLWVLVPVIGWLAPALAGKSLMFKPQVLEQAEWYSLLKLTDPLLLLL